MTKTLLSSLIALSLFAAGSAAEAATKKIKLDANELGFISPATGGDGISVNLPDAATSFVTVPVVLPADFKKNSQLKFKINYTIGQIGCNLALTPYIVLRVRNGKAPAGGVVNVAGTGLVFAGSTTVAAPAVSGAVFSHTAVLNKPTVGAMTSQQAGDTITVAFIRGGSAAADTCTNGLGATGATIIYQTN